MVSRRWRRHCLILIQEKCNFFLHMKNIPFNMTHVGHVSGNFFYLLKLFFERKLILISRSCYSNVVSVCVGMHHVSSQLDSIEWKIEKINDNLVVAGNWVRRVIWFFWKIFLWVNFEETRILRVCDEMESSKSQSHFDQFLISNLR